MQTIAIIENMQRENLPLFDEMEAISKLLEKDKLHIVAKKVSKDIGYIKNRMRAIKIIKKHKITDRNMRLKDIFDVENIKSKDKIKETLSVANLSKNDKDESNDNTNESKDKIKETLSVANLSKNDTKKQLKEEEKNNSSNDGLIEEKINTKDIIEENKLVNDEKELILFFDEIKNTDFKISILTNGEVVMRGNKLSFNKIMEKLK
jgi:transcription elongation GreA/GreB family factor